jgi:hypothetical protein
LEWRTLQGSYTFRNYVGNDLADLIIERMEEPIDCRVKDIAAVPDVYLTRRDAYEEKYGLGKRARCK